MTGVKRKRDRGRLYIYMYLKTRVISALFAIRREVLTVMGMRLDDWLKEEEEEEEEKQ